MPNTLFGHRLPTPFGSRYAGHFSAAQDHGNSGILENVFPRGQESLAEVPVRRWQVFSRQRLPTPTVVALLAFIVVAVSPTALAAQDAAAPTPDKDRAASLAQAEAHVGALEVRLAGGGDQVARIDKPLLVFGDSTRNNGDGTLWAWGQKGRPLVVIETYRNTTEGGPRASALTLTSTDKVVLTTPLISQEWRPATMQIVPTALPDAEAPDEREAVRLRQLKAQARRLTAHEFWDPDNSRFELRLLVQPVHRYRDEQAKLWDGAIFVLAHDTNPEVLVLIEALGETRDKARWHYSLARLGSAELHVELDGREVWKQDRAPGIVGRPTDPYWLFLTRVDSPLEPKK